MMNAIEVDIFGQRLALQGDADQQYVHELAQYVEGQMNSIARNLTTSTPTKVAILAAINIADQLFKQESRRQAGEAEVERRADGLLQSIDAQIGGEAIL
ncbi:cell division protein ZapA [Candidatus Nitronereus thalassa]|uniref:Cell division protein ZapA n=1 Tax=Candidatus Nitronereus thalassa TaxID=3020898 RepID=A0ABU3KA93_9BACT|nr:cell division protein ZapA [Candidatus Nitronereus thalassa]MDT7043326.1 cell division protein ZapA [Candidatus Nitronereus thalassa]